MSQHAEPAGLSTPSLRLLARFWIWFLFREVAVRGVGRVPAAGPVLLCVNHPNNLIDSLLVGAVLPRKVHFLANASLFRNPVLGALLVRGGAIAVHRRQESPESRDRNAETFVAARRGARRRATCSRSIRRAPLTPKAASSGSRPARLGSRSTTRALRGTGAPDALSPLALVPVGLSFEIRKSFRGRVLVAFGEPVPLAPHVARAREEPVAAVQSLTDAIQSAMEAEVVHVDRIDAAEFVRAVEDLYRDELSRQLHAERGLPPEAIDVFRLSRAIVEAVAHFKERDPHRVAELWQRIQHYRALLVAWHVRDQAVGARLRGERAPHRLRSSTAAVLGLPVFLYGSVVNALPYLIPRVAGPRLRPEGDGLRDDPSALEHRRLSHSAGGSRSGSSGGSRERAGRSPSRVSLPLTGLLAYHYLRGLGRLRAQDGFAILALTHHQAAARLLAERRAILATLERAKTDFLAARDVAHAEPAEAGRPPLPSVEVGSAVTDGRIQGLPVGRPGRPERLR